MKMNPAKLTKQIEAGQVTWEHRRDHEFTAPASKAGH
jgi:hypothetical protein